jgi:hypothetical protein
MKPHGSIWVVRKCCDVRIDPIVRCLVNPYGLNSRDLLVGVVPEFSSWLTV